MTASALALAPELAHGLVDRFGRRHTYLRISLTDRCNLRCGYCMPPEGIAWTPRPSLLTEDEVVRLASVFVHMGIDKIRLTGGEPLVRRDLESIASRIAALPGLSILAMTTNGISLDRRAASLRAAGLNTLTISLDTLRRDRFLEITKRDSFDAVMAGIEASLAAGYAPVKINMVVMRGVNDDEIEDFVTWAQDRPLQIRFIEYMPFPGNHWHKAGVVPWSEIRERLETRWRLAPIAVHPSAVAKEFALVGHQGSVGFVTSMTDSFCGTCNRLRLTSDGNLKTCLFHPAEQSLRDALRAGADDDAIETQIAYAVGLKQAAHAPMEELTRLGNRAMVEIGG
ncbi:MAG: molybdenum cofactor biosynthesis protein [Rhodospirillales bacterium]|nr:molybdenum cofactor biosynthesis protein [Rhodospirillales bacterium]